MAARGRSYGLAFKRDFLRENAQAQPVWYLDEGFLPLIAVRARMRELAASESWDDPFWLATPFIETVEDGRRDWRWEREWRIRGDFRFELADVALIITLGDDHEIFDGVELGSAVYDSDGDYFWASGSLEALGPSMELLLRKFHETFTPLDDADLPRDREEEHGYFPLVPILSTEDAVEWLYDTLPVEVRIALQDDLDVRSLYWCRDADWQDFFD